MITTKTSTNPIHANQIVGLDVESTCVDVECKSLPNYLEDLYSQLCELKNESFTIGCLSVDNNRVAVINELISKVCSLENSSGDSSTSTTELDLSGINGALSDNWQINDNTAINITGSNEDIIQALFSRVVALEDIIKDLNTTNQNLQTMYNDLQVEIQNKPCC